MNSGAQSVPKKCSDRWIVRRQKLVQIRHSSPTRTAVEKGDKSDGGNSLFDIRTSTTWHSRCGFRREVRIGGIHARLFMHQCKMGPFSRRLHAAAVGVSHTRCGRACRNFYKNFRPNSRPGPRASHSIYERMYVQTWVARLTPVDLRFKSLET